MYRHGLQGMSFAVSGQKKNWPTLFENAIGVPQGTFTTAFLKPQGTGKSYLIIS